MEMFMKSCNDIIKEVAAEKYANSFGSEERQDAFKEGVKWADKNPSEKIEKLNKKIFYLECQISDMLSTGYPYPDPWRCIEREGNPKEDDYFENMIIAIGNSRVMAFYDGTYWRDDMNEILVTPTHWMPIPKLSIARQCKEMK